jgi:tight adherence protein B
LGVVKVGVVRRRGRSAGREPDRATDAERLAAVAAASRSGASAREAWGEWGGETVLTDDGVPILDREDDLARDAMAAARLAHESGVPLADLVSALARVEAVRENARLAIAVAMAGPRASASLLGWLPVAGLAIGVVVEPRTIAVLATTGLGWGLVFVAVILMALGRRWMGAMLRTASAAGEIP